ncbi:MAG: NAD(P)/FAD-dependent oxidoreductase [Halanaerobiales bacterium]
MKYDIVVIGGGLVGTAVARELSRYKLDIVLLEKKADIACGTSKANSGIIHAGYNALSDTVKGRLNVRANPQFDELCEDLNVPFKRIGSLVVGFNKNDLKKIKEIKENGEKNGIRGLEIWDHKKIRKEEKNINTEASYALYAPTAGIISPYELAIAYADNAVINGVEVKLNTEVKDINKTEDGDFVVQTGEEGIKAELIINAAGVFADKIAQMNGEKMKIHPRKGEYHLYDKEYGDMVDHVLFPIPAEETKGILVTPTVHGNLLIGPNAYYVDDKTDVSTTGEGMEEVLKGARRLVPDLPGDGIITSFSGLRAASETEDFIITFSEKVEGLIHAAGIQSPGLSSVPAIADKVLELVEGYVADYSPDFDLVYDKEFEKENPEYPHLQDYEQNPADWQRFVEENEDYGKIICRCESVSKGEIVDAIQRPVPAQTLDAIKRRTRAGGGRCQGGFCQPRVIKILSEELDISPLEVTKRGGNSYVLAARAKELIEDERRGER